MLVDLIAKPLQRALFVCMCEKIINLPISTYANIHRNVLEDRKKNRKDTSIKDTKEKDMNDTKGGKESTRRVRVSEGHGRPCVEADTQNWERTTRLRI